MMKTAKINKQDSFSVNDQLTQKELIKLIERLKQEKVQGYQFH